MPCDLKGLGFHGLFTALKQTQGEGVLGQVLAALPDELGDLARNGGLLASGWYPLTWYAVLHAEIERHAPGQARRLGKVSAQNDVNTAFKFVLGLASPALLTRMSPAIFKAFLRGPKIEPKLAGSGAVITFQGCDGATLPVWQDFEGSMEAFVELAGGQHTRVSMDPLDLPGCAVFRVRWA